MQFLQVDVFAEGPYRGNPLAVFPDAARLEAGQMQAIACEMNLSETAFVTRAEADTYDVRIFTPVQEVGFAGHPTVGTAWTLRHLGMVHGEVLEQRSPAGVTRVQREGDLNWFERGESEVEESYRLAAESLGLEEVDLGCSFRGVKLLPALSSAGFTQLMVPVADGEALHRAEPGWQVPHGTYCFTPSGAERIRARGFFPTYGVPEDPATGSAAAALGLYLAARVGGMKAVIEQGAECGRPSMIHLQCEPGRVRIGGRCALVATGDLVTLPPTTI